MALTQGPGTTVAEARAKFRQYTVDEDPNSPARTNAECDSVIMDIYQKMWAFWNADRIEQKSGGSLWGGIGPNVAVPSVLIYVGVFPLRHVLRLYRTTSTSAQPGPTTPELEKMERHELIWLQNNRPQATELFKAYSLERADPRDATTATTYNIRLWPVTNAATIGATTYSVAGDVQFQPPKALSEDTDYFNLDIEQANIMVRVAAAIDSGRRGRSQQFIENIWRTIPEDVAAYLKVEQSSKAPREYAGEAAY